MSSGKIHSLGYVYVPFRNDESKERIEKKIKNRAPPWFLQHLVILVFISPYFVCFHMYICTDLYLYLCIYTFFCKLDYSFSRLCIILSSTYQKHLSMSQNAQWRIWQF